MLDYQAGSWENHSIATFDYRVVAMLCSHARRFFGGKNAKRSTKIQRRTYGSDAEQKHVKVDTLWLCQNSYWKWPLK